MMSSGTAPAAPGDLTETRAAPSLHQLHPLQQQPTAASLAQQQQQQPNPPPLRGTSQHTPDSSVASAGCTRKSATEANGGITVLARSELQRVSYISGVTLIERADVDHEFATSMSHLELAMRDSSYPQDLTKILKALLLEFNMLKSQMMDVAFGGWTIGAGISPQLASEMVWLFFHHTHPLAALPDLLDALARNPLDLPPWLASAPASSSLCSASTAITASRQPPTSFLSVADSGVTAAVDVLLAAPPRFLSIAGPANSPAVQWAACVRSAPKSKGDVSGLPKPEDLCAILTKVNDDATMWAQYRPTFLRQVGIVYAHTFVRNWNNSPSGDSFAVSAASDAVLDILQKALQSHKRFDGDVFASYRRQGESSADTMDIIVGLIVAIDMAFPAFEGSGYSEWFECAIAPGDTLHAFFNRLRSVATRLNIKEEELFRRVSAALQSLLDSGTSQELVATIYNTFLEKVRHRNLSVTEALRVMGTDVLMNRTPLQKVGSKAVPPHKPSAPAQAAAPTTLNTTGQEQQRPPRNRTCYDMNATNMEVAKFGYDFTPLHPPNGTPDSPCPKCVYLGYEHFDRESNPNRQLTAKQCWFHKSHTCTRTPIFAKAFKEQHPTCDSTQFVREVARPVNA